MAKRKSEVVAGEPIPPRLAGGEFKVVAMAPGVDDRWEAASAANVDWTGSIARGWRLDGGRLAGVRAPAATWIGVRFDDVWASACDFANGDWTGCAMQRVDLREARFTGANLSEGRLVDVRMTGCKLTQLAGHAWVTVRCRFEGCDFREADFEGADLRGATFRHCDLRGARFNGARLDGTDVRGSNVAGLFVDPSNVRGLVIDPLQAVDLVALMGVDLRSAP